MRNLQEQVKKAFCYQKLFWPFTVWINCCSDLKNFADSRPSASNFKRFSQSLEQFFLKVGQNNFGNKIPFANLVPPWKLRSYGKSKCRLRILVCIFLNWLFFQLKKIKTSFMDTPIQSWHTLARGGNIYKTIGKLHIVLLHVCMYDCII